MNIKPRLLYVVNVDWFFISHRLCIAEKALKNGWEVIVASEDSGRSEEITAKGIIFIPFPFSRSGTNPLVELNLLLKFKKLYKDLSPDLVHHITLKPVIYGSLAAKLTKIPAVVNAVSGLGYNFTDNNKSIISNIMVKLMKIGFKHRKISFIFQNKDDYKELRLLKVLNAHNSINFIKGSGVDLKHFNYSSQPVSGRVKILFPVRMLWDKGVQELRDASEILKDEFYTQIQFVLVGLADIDNKAGVSASYLNDWQNGDYVTWLGYQTNMVSLYQNSNIVVLPSYREGMPKTLIEACATGRPIVTSNAIGCKECVDEGINGFKVPVKNSVELAKALKTLIINKDLRQIMGENSRRKAELEFDQIDVVNRHIKIYNYLVNE